MNSILSKIFFLSFLFFPGTTLSQSSDFLVLKKRGVVQQSFYSGTPILFSTANASYSGIVEKIDKDSIYLLQYDIRTNSTRLGVYVLDTFAVYRMKFNYRDIISINKKTKKFNLLSSGGALLGNGILLTTLGLGSWLVTKKDSRYYARPELIAGSASCALIGYMIMRNAMKPYTFGKKYRLEYIHTK